MLKAKMKPREITIENYDHGNGSTLDCSIFGVDIDKNYYLVKLEDYQGIIERDGRLIRMPRTAYLLISCNPGTMTAIAREVTNRPLLEKIAVELDIINREADIRSREKIEELEDSHRLRYE